MLTRSNTAKTKSLIILMLCGVLVSMPVAAQRYSLGGMIPLNQQQMVLAKAGGESLDSAVARIRKQTGGRVLSAETKQEGEVMVHYIRVLTKSGKVKRFRVVAN